MSKTKNGELFVERIFHVIQYNRINSKYILKHLSSGLRRCSASAVCCDDVISSGLKVTVTAENGSESSEFMKSDMFVRRTGSI